MMRKERPGKEGWEEKANWNSSKRHKNKLLNKQIQSCKSNKRSTTIYKAQTSNMFLLPFEYQFVGMYFQIIQRRSGGQDDLLSITCHYADIFLRRRFPFGQQTFTLRRNQSNWNRCGLNHLIVHDVAAIERLLIGDEALNVRFFYFFAVETEHSCLTDEWQYERVVEFRTWMPNV